MIPPRGAWWASWIESWRGLLWLFGIGLAVRLILARYSVGMTFDVTLFRTYLHRMVELGPSGFYGPGYWDDYPPGYLYILLALGKVHAAVRGVAPSMMVLKLPAIVADLGIAVFALLLAGRISPEGHTRGLPVRAMAAAAILLNPAVILISSVWGQVDSVLAFLVLAAVFALAGPATLAREACAVALLAVAVATKPQAVLALPVFAVVLMRRHFILDAGSRSLPAIVGRFALLATAAVAVIVAMFTPFGVAPAGIVDFYRGGGSIYPFTSLWAFNAWGATGFYRPDVGAGAPSIGGIAALYIGLAAFAVAAVAVAAWSWRSLSRRVDADVIALFGVVAVTCAGFALLTRMHERYLYLAIVGLAPFVGARRLRWALAVLSLCFLLNVHFVYVFYSQHSLPPTGAWTIQPVFDALFGRARDASELKALSLITTISCLAVAFLGWRWLEPVRPVLTASSSFTPVK